MKDLVTIELVPRNGIVLKSASFQTYPCECGDNLLKWNQFNSRGEVGSAFGE
ncbi:MAG TPA: hypothetical protein VEC37_07025 [Bacillota bacterium]|nr:hypothetical protein [Bacillota bacterium]